MPEELLQIQETIWSSSTGSLTRILAFWPNIVAAIGIFLFGWIFSIFVEKLIIKISAKIKLPHFAEKAGFNIFLKKANITSPPGVVIAKFLSAWILTIFLLSATKILRLDAVSNFLETIINFLPSLVVALLILIFSVRVGDFIGAIVESSLKLANSSSSKIAGVFVKNILIAFGIMAVLVQLNIAANLVQIVFTGFIAMLALAGGLAFGLGGKEVVHEILQDLKNKKSGK